MTQEQLQQLEELRSKILNEVAPLATDSEDLEPAQRVELLMISAESAEDPVPLVSKAYEIANKIEDKRERADVLLDILNSVETLLVEPDQSADTTPEQTLEKEVATTENDQPEQTGQTQEQPKDTAPEPTQPASSGASE